ncbi:hypothetical protein F5Y02DRAFT_380513 [Annulohypoxylon stygium]|nr:hypothetical protein F5Y02DRAFT_380513 [Annulohypoxylon stygium]
MLEIMWPVLGLLILSIQVIFSVQEIAYVQWNTYRYFSMLGVSITRRLLEKDVKVSCLPFPNRLVRHTCELGRS